MVAETEKNGFAGVIERMKAEGSLLRNSGTNSLKVTNKTLVSVNDSIQSLSNIFKEYVEFNKTDALRDSLKDDQTSASLDGGKSKLEEEAEKTSSGLGLSMFGIVASATAALGFLAAPLKPLVGFLTKIGKFVMKGGPIGAIIFGLYAVFKDIADNENFKGTIDSLQASWDSIKLTWVGIQEKFAAITGDLGISVSWDTVMGVVDSFIKNIQDFVLTAIGTIATTFDGLLTAFSMALDGDFAGAFKTAITALWTGARDFVDSALTNILEFFGVDFGKDGSLFTSISNRISNLYINMSLKFLEFKNAVVNFFSDTMTTIADFFTTAITNLQTRIETLWGNITTTVSDLWTDLTTSVTTAVTDVITFVKNMFAWGGDIVTEGWTNLTGYVGTQIDNVVTWAKGMFYFAKDLLTNATFTLFGLVDEVLSDAIGSIKSIFSGDFSFENFTKLFGSIFDIIYAPINMAVNAVGSMFGFTDPENPFRLSTFISGVFDDVVGWFEDRFSGLTDLLPSIASIKGAIVANLPSWMVPDSFKTSEQRAKDLSYLIDEEQEKVDRANRGENVYMGFDSSGIRRSEEEIKRLRNELADVVGYVANDNAGTVVVNNLANGGNNQAITSTILMGQGSNGRNLVARADRGGGGGK